VRDPYRTLVAETLLHQTQAARAAPAFERFVQRFPDVERLARAPVDEVLRAWEGLGYYRRAHALHAAALEIASAHGGTVPTQPDELQRLPGVGRYTAVAVAAQACGVPGVAVDANVRRIGRRVLGSSEASDAAIADRLGALLLARGGGWRRRAEVAEALIELGAQLCSPRAPRCSDCPLALACVAHQLGRPERFSPPARRGEPREERWHALVARQEGRVALVRRPPRRRWAGLWGFPAAPDGAATLGTHLPAVAHRLTHRRLSVVPVIACASAAPADADWVALDDLSAGAAPVPVAVLDRKIAAMVRGSSLPVAAVDGGRAETP
jgi:A/G-specific adenine glycosylase